MAKRAKPIPLSSMTGGLNRFSSQAGSNQTVDALDVYEKGGELVRRPSFAAFGAAAPHKLPLGQTTIKLYNYATQTWTTPSSGVTAATSLTYFGVSTTAASRRARFFVGCDTSFDGVDLAVKNANVSALGGEGHTNRWARVRFVTSNWTDHADPADDEGYYSTIQWNLDTTARGLDNSVVEEARIPLTRSGQILWHRDQIPTGWGAKTVDGVSAYWVIIDFGVGKGDVEAPDDTDYDAAVASGAATAQVCVRPFRLGRVTGLFPLGNGRSEWLISSYATRRGQERGPQLGRLDGVGRPTLIQGLAKDWGSGMIGSWSPGLWSSEPIGPGTGSLEKNDKRYDWAPARASGSSFPFEGAWGWPVLRREVAPDALGTTTSFSANIGTSYDTEFEDCVLECSTTGGVAEGELARVKSSTYSSSTGLTTFTVNSEDAFSAAPTTSARFTLKGQSHRLTCMERLGLDAYAAARMWLEIPTVTDSDTVSVSGLLTNLEGGWALDDEHVFFSIEKEPRYDLPGYEYPSYCYDDVTKEFLFAFGDYPIHRWDGFMLRPLLASSNPTDPGVAAWTGQVVERFAGDIENPSWLKNSVLREQPPQGKFITTFRGRVFVAGIASDVTTIQYSAPGFSNAIWPGGYETFVRTPEGDPITGLAVLNDELVAFTANSIHASPQPEDTGYMSMTPRSKGIGFINNRVVQHCTFGQAAVLLGANADGIYGYTGAEPFVVLDDWERLIDGGVNRATMHRACAAYARYENTYYLAVPSQTAEFPDRVILYNTSKKTFYVWTAPYGGITSMAVHRNSAGEETVVFGHVDGTLSTLVNNKTDDGDAITGYAFTPPIVSGGRTMKPIALTATFKDMGGTETVAIATHLNESNVANQTFTKAFDAGDVELGSFTLGTSRLARERMTTRRLPSKAGSTGTSIQFKVSGAGRWTYRGGELLAYLAGQRLK